jgi:hypothetical protein
MSSNNIERDLEKAFHWFQKAAEGGSVEAMCNLAIRYYGEKGTERDLEKTFYWSQKAAEGGNVKAMCNLAIHYYSGEGMERNLEKAFHWSQKAAEGGSVDAMHNLAICYYNGKGTERDLEKAFYWSQKAAEGGSVEAMHSLAIRYSNGEGMERDLEKAFYWFQKVVESNNSKISFKNTFELCSGCKQPYTDYQWCQQCNSKQFQQDFLKWTSGNLFIDRFIQDAQLNVKSCYEVLEWIPYNKLSNINYHDKGRFGEIHKAIWLDGPINSWNFNKQQWNRWNFQTGYEVILKTLNNSSNLESNFLDEVYFYI